MDVIAVDHHVAQVDAYTELDPLVRRPVCIALSCRLLDFGCSTHSVDDAGKLGQRPIAHELNDAAVVLRDLGIDEISTQCLEGRDCAFLVSAD